MSERAISANEVARMRVTIAYYGRPKAFMCATLILIGVVFLFAVTLYSSGEPIFEHIESHGQFWLPLVVISWICGAIMFLLALALLKKLVFDKGEAVWIENGNVVYLNRCFLAANCDDIEEVLRGTFGRFNQRAIILRMHDGNKRVIPTGLLSESGDQVIERLKEYLGAA